MSQLIKEEYGHSNVETIAFASGNEAIRKAVSRADFVIVAPYQSRSTLDQYDWRLLQSVIDLTNAQAKPYTVLSLGNPYEWMFVNDVKTYLPAYGDGRPNIKAALNLIFQR